MIILKILGIVALVAAEGLSLITLYTCWLGKGMKDPLTSIFFFIPVLMLAAFGAIFIGFSFGGPVLKRIWWLAIPPIAVFIDAIVKFNQ